MNKSSEHNTTSHGIQGAGRLTIDAITGMTDLVESMHQAIASMGGMVDKSGTNRTRGITGFVYRQIRSITSMVGKGLDVPLRLLDSLVNEGEFSPGREALISALNGVLGDHLVAQDNPLAIEMRFRRAGRSLSETGLSDLIRQGGSRLVIMVHGLCMNDLHWNREGHDHGQALSRDLGVTPMYLRYNSGRHTSENGRDLSVLLESMLEDLPQSIELNIIAHSMGGLVTRSACHHAKQADHAWLKNLKKIVFLGTPHHGAPLEKAGNWIDRLLEISPWSAPFSRLGKIRSAGVTDLRHGNVVEQDWQGQDRFDGSGKRHCLELPDEVQCYAIAGSTSRQAGLVGDHLLGDGLVTVGSALGRHQNPELQLSFPQSHQWVGRNVNHLALLNHPEVYHTLRNWIADT